MNKIYPLLILVCFSLDSNNAYSQVKKFTREYTYQASELDSKISSRTIAISQLRQLLLEEVGVYVESERLLKTADLDGKFSQDMIENITTITAGITKLEILDESWDGLTYWIKASITIDKKTFEESLKNIVESKTSLKELERLQAQLSKANNEIIRLRRIAENEQVKSNESKLLDEYNTEVNTLIAVDYILSAANYMETHNYQAAIEYANKAVQIDPSNSYGYILLGLAHFLTEDYSNAIKDFDSALKAEDNSNIFQLRAFAKDKTEDHQGAIRDFNIAIQLDPINAKSYYGRANAKGSLGDYHGANQDFTKAIELDPTQVAFYAARGLSSYSLNKFQEALKDYDKAIQTDPDYARTYYNRGILRLRQGKKTLGCMDLSKSGELGYEKAYDLITRFCK